MFDSNGKNNLTVCKEMSFGSFKNFYQHTICSPTIYFIYVYSRLAIK